MEFILFLFLFFFLLLMFFIRLLMRQICDANIFPFKKKKKNERGLMVCHTYTLINFHFENLVEPQI